jgi:Cytochrome C oxidase, cbb3-type, subunit III
MQMENHMPNHRHLELSLWALCAVLGLAACAVELQNQQPAKALAQSRRAPGSVYTGWRVFQDKCVRCHGPDAQGSANAPDLLPRVAAVGPRRFLDLVLTRYEWDLPASAQSRSEAAPRETLIDQIMQREQGALRMPAWQGEPEVQAHIVDLYAYLAARAQGTQGAGRPMP